MKMAGPMHPPFSLFLLEEKERMRRARWKREKEVTPCGGRETGARLECLRFWAKVFGPRRSFSGGFGGCRIELLLFSLPLIWRLRGDTAEWLCFFLLALCLMRSSLVGGEKEKRFLSGDDLEGLDDEDFGQGVKFYGGG